MTPYFGVVMEPPPRPTPSLRSTLSTPSFTSRRSRSRAIATPATPATPAGHRNTRIRWTGEMEEAMLKGLIEAVKKGFRVDSSYKFNGWKIAFNHTLAIAQQPVTLKQIKSKHDNHKKD